MGELPVRSRFIALIGVAGMLVLAGCGLFGHKPPVTHSARLIVTGAPMGSVLWIDGAQIGQPTGANDRTQTLRVAPGSHLLEVKAGDTITYREDTYVDVGDERVINVLSGFSTP